MTRRPIGSDPGSSLRYAVRSRKKQIQFGKTEVVDELGKNRSRKERKHEPRYRDSPWKSGYRSSSFSLHAPPLPFGRRMRARNHNYYVDRGCSGCHGATPTTCNGCHEHGVNGRTGSPQSATVNKTTFAPGENVIVTLRGGRTSSATNGTGGWVRGILYRDNVEIARSAGTVAPGNIGPSGGSGLPITFTTPAPTTPGTYTYAAAWFGNTEITPAVRTRK